MGQLSFIYGQFWVYYMLSKALNTLPSGFRYIPNFITNQQKQHLLTTITKNPWCTRLHRHQQYYGIKYFQTKYLDSQLQKKQSIDHLPLDELNFIIQRVKKTLNIKSFLSNQGSPNQVLVNKYMFRDKLGYHVEDVEAFGDCIVGLSLGDVEYLKLVPADQTGHDKVGVVQVKLEDRSVYILENQARYRWKHGIGKIVDGKPYKSQDFMRISLTFRDVIDTRRKL